MYKIMKIRDLKNYGIPTYVLDIWKEHYSPCLLPLQEEAVKNYGILNCGENEDKEGRMQYAPTEEIDSCVHGNDRGEGSDEIAAPSSKARNDREEETSHNHPHPAFSPQGRGNEDNINLLVVAPPSSGKSFLGEMAAMAQAIHQKKIIYLAAPIFNMQI